MTEDWQLTDAELDRREESDRWRCPLAEQPTGSCKVTVTYAWEDGQWAGLDEGKAERDRLICQCDALREVEAERDRWREAAMRLKRSLKRRNAPFSRPY